MALAPSHPVTNLMVLAEDKGAAPLVISSRSVGEQFRGVDPVVAVRRRRAASRGCSRVRID